MNNGARALESIIARWEKDTNFSVLATLSGSVIQMTVNQASLTLTGTTSNYRADLMIGFTMGANPITGAASINLNGIGAISLRDNEGTSLSSSALLSGVRVQITKDATNDYFRMLSPAVPVVGRAAFRATNELVSNVTGDGTNYTIVFATEVFDQGSDFDGTSTFTAPVTGRYLLTSLVRSSGWTGGVVDQTELRLTTSNDTFSSHSEVSNWAGAEFSHAIAVVTDMDAADTATVILDNTGDTGGKVHDIRAGEAHFSGALLA